MHIHEAAHKGTCEHTLYNWDVGVINPGMSKTLAQSLLSQILTVLTKRSGMVVLKVDMSYMMRLCL